jgi:hypothetical protein
MTWFTDIDANHSSLPPASYETIILLARGIQNDSVASLPASMLSMCGWQGVAGT